MDRKKCGFYLPWIDGLRAVAALSVVVHHGPTLHSIPGFKNFLGWFGVDLFLVLSAFLLSRLLQLEYAATGTIRIKDFFIRRALRIWPLYFLFITISFAYAITTHQHESRPLIGWYLAFLTFTQNIANMVHEGGIIPFTGQLWTIGLEEQAYLLMPFAMVLYLKNENRRALHQFFVAALVGFMVIRLSVVLLGRVHPYIYASPLRLDTFLAGIYMALVASVGGILPKNRGIACATGAAFLAIASTCIRMGPPGVSSLTEVIGYPLTAAACCFLIASIDRSVVAARILGMPVMRRLGKLSYGIYVFHVFGLETAARIAAHFSVGPWGSLGITLAITIVLAETSYRVLEKPFLLLKIRYSPIQSRPA